MDERKPGVRARFAQVNIVIADMERSMAFYRLLGVEVTEMLEPWGAHHHTVSNVNADVTVEFDSVVNWRPDR